ncbi:hypothetical protein EV421DRAFT_1904829 [Armillaria borealis]|uniref:Uncharacterized protein n=1 Tax=Armillaria borealis TaxID=47425 RepID=A0AA39JJ37_9AGAR|nr:hypothetical protein EV421DRAFT_1904829 [Armillaria borealis]
MPDPDIPQKLLLDAPAMPGHKLAPLTKQRHWHTMQAAIQSRREGKLYVHRLGVSAICVKQSDLFRDFIFQGSQNFPKKRAFDNPSIYQYVPASPGNRQIGDSELDQRYNGPTTWDFMTLEIDMSNGTTAILNELASYRTTFNAGINSLKLQAGSRGPGTTGTTGRLD